MTPRNTVPRRSRPRLRSAAEFVQSTLSYLLILAVAGLLAVAVVVPRLSDAVPYTVLTSSMRPTYPPGTLIIVRKAPTESLGIGDAITYQLESKKPAVVTHRIVGVGYNASGERTFQTKGDNNRSVDDQSVRAVQVRGAVWYAIPLLGHVNAWIAGSRELLVNIVVALLLVYAAWMFLAQSRKRSSAGAQPTATGNGAEQ